MRRVVLRNRQYAVTAASSIVITERETPVLELSATPSARELRTAIASSIATSTVQPAVGTVVELRMKPACVS